MNVLGTGTGSDDEVEVVSVSDREAERREETRSERLPFGMIVLRTDVSVSNFLGSSSTTKSFKSNARIISSTKVRC